MDGVGVKRGQFEIFTKCFDIVSTLVINLETFYVNARHVDDRTVLLKRHTEGLKKVKE